MKYLSLDIETTGLDKDTCQVIQVGAVVDDLISPIETLPKFSAFVEWPQLQFEPYALKMHIRSGLMLRHIEAKDKKALDGVLIDLEAFLNVNLPITGKEKRVVAGKNIAGFDIPFLRANQSNQFHERIMRNQYIVDTFNPPRKNVLDTFSHRVVDPGTSFTDFYTDSAPANLDECKSRAGLTCPPVSHDALDDAYDVIRVVRQIAANNKFLRSLPNPRTG